MVPQLQATVIVAYRLHVIEAEAQHLRRLVHQWLIVVLAERPLPVGVATNYICAVFRLIKSHRQYSFYVGDVIIQF